MEIEIIRDYHETGKLWYQATHIKNILHGPYLSYYINGNLSRSCIFQKGLVYGIDQEFWTNGTRDYLEQNRNSISHGLDIAFNY